MGMFFFGSRKGIILSTEILNGNIGDGTFLDVQYEQTKNAKTRQLAKASVKIADRQQQSMQDATKDVTKKQVPARTKMEIYAVPKLHLQKVFRSLHPPKKLSCP